MAEFWLLSTTVYLTGTAAVTNFESIKIEDGQ